MEGTKRTKKPAKYKVLSVGTKYKNKIVMFNGIKFHSILEMNCYKSIKKYCDALPFVKVSLQVPFLLTGKSKYIADFVITSPNITRPIVIDAKGVETKTFKIKKQLMLIKRGLNVYCAKTPSMATSVLKSILV